MQSNWERLYTCKAEGSSERRGSRDRTTLERGWESDEEGWLCHDFATTNGHFINHTDLSAFAVSKTPLLIPLLPWSSSISVFSFLRLFLEKVSLSFVASSFSSTFSSNRICPLPLTAFSEILSAGPDPKRTGVHKILARACE